MSNFFEELGLLDRPFVDVTIKVPSGEKKLRARALSGQEADALEALQFDEYGRILAQLMDSKPDAISELERVRRVYESQPVTALATQMASTREQDILKRAIDKTGINFRREAEVMEGLPEDERDAYAKQRNDELEAAQDEAREQFIEEYSRQTQAELAKQLAQVNTNLRAQREAVKVFNSYYLFYTLFHPTLDERIFTGPDDAAGKWGHAMINTAATAVKEALNTDAPFGSPVDSEPVKPSSSPDTPEEATVDSGTPTTTTSDASP